MYGQAEDDSFDSCILISSNVVSAASAFKQGGPCAGDRHIAKVHALCMRWSSSLAPQKTCFYKNEGSALAIQQLSSAGHMGPWPQGAVDVACKLPWQSLRGPPGWPPGAQLV